ncbi:MAG: ATP-binding protein [Chitinophagaceae bacterium]
MRSLSEQKSILPVYIQQTTMINKIELPGELKNIFYNANQNCILFIDERGLVLNVNPAFTVCFGYTTEDIAGKHIEIFFTPEDRDKGLPERELQTVLKSGQASDNNYLVSKDGTQTWVSGESILMHSEGTRAVIIKIIQNIHAQKESELAITHLHSFNEDILASIHDVVVVINNNYQVVKANKSFTHLFPTNGHSVENADLMQIIARHDNDNRLRDHITKAFIENIGFHNQVMTISETGSEPKMFEVNGIMISQAANMNNLLIVFHDITLYKQLEKEREDIIGFVAHEIRNPLSNIGLCNELLHLLIHEKKYHEIPDMLQRNSNNINRLNKMIAELYTATKISTGNIVLEIERYNFGIMVQEAVDTIQLLQPDYHIHVAGDADIEVEGDRYRMMEVVNNYLSNGIKYSNGGREIFLRIEKTTESVTVLVKDNGLGIPSLQLPFIFERFFRAEKTKNLEGLGLGLYLCQRIISAHKGRVWAESEEGKGSIFFFTVPLRFI